MKTDEPLANPSLTANTFGHRRKSLPFRPRVQFIGMLHWLCPACGKISRAHLTPTAGWKVYCKSRLCGAVFAVGWNFWQLPQGAAQIPPLDIGLPADPFPEAAVGFLDGRYVHEAIP